MDKHMCNVKLTGTVNVGSKGQIVLPKELRDKLDIKPGDSLSVLLKDEKFIGIVKNDDLNELMEFVKNK